MANIISQSKWAQAPEYRDLPIAKQRELYQKYIASQVSSNNAQSSKTTDDIAYRYRQFLKNIILYVTQEDAETQRYLANLDFNNKNDISLALPFYVKRLKEIALHYTSKRRELEDVKYRLNKKGSTEGFKRFIKNLLLTLVSDASFKSRHPKLAIPDYDVIVKNTAINVEQLYDVNTDYHDNIEDDIEGLIYFDTNFKKSVEKIFKKYPIELKSKNGNIIRTSKETLIRVNVKRDNFKQLPLRHFFRGDVSLDNLEFNYKKQKYEAYAGTDHHYLSGDGSTGKLFTAKAPHKNLTNQKFTTVARSNKSKTLKKINELGGWFLPKNFGILSLYSRGASVTYSTTGLSADSIITFPDPTKYGDIKQTGKITFTEDHSWLKAGRGNEYITGDIYDADGLFVHKLWPYQSKEETLKYSFQGLSRAEDPVDFWIGDNRLVWSNSDVYPKKPLEDYDTSSKQQDLIVTDQTSYAWHSDSFGNEFALYKETVPTKQAKTQSAGRYKTQPGNVLQQGDDTKTFDPNQTLDMDHDLFKEPQIKIFQHTYSIAWTEYDTQKNSLTADRSLFDKQNIYGKLYFRNAYSSVIAPLEEMYDSLFIKYINDDVIMDELKNKVKDFDVFDNIIVVRTENYLIVEKYFLDPETGYVKATPTPKIMFKISAPAYEKIGKPWFYEDGNQLFVVQTKLHPYVKDSNFKLVYPEITIVNLDNLRITKAFPNSDNIKNDIETQPFETYNEFANKNISMIGADMMVNFVKVGVPQITFNKGTSTYAITYTAFDEFNYTYLFTIWMKKRESTFFISRSTLMTPDKTVMSVDFTNFRELEKQIKQFVSIASYPTSKLVASTTLPSNITDHGYIPGNNSLLLAGGVIAGGTVSQDRQSSVNEVYASKADRTTIMTVNTGVQGGEKITMLAEAAYYNTALSGVDVPLSAHGSTMFFYGVFNPSSLNYSNSIIDSKAIPETGYDHRIIMSDDFKDIDEKYIDNLNIPDQPIVSNMTWHNYANEGNYKRIVKGDTSVSDDNYCLEFGMGLPELSEFAQGPAACVFHLSETLVPGKRYRVSYKAKLGSEIGGPFANTNGGRLLMSFQNGSGDQNNLGHQQIIRDTTWKTFTHEVILNEHKKYMYMLIHDRPSVVHFDDFKLEELIPKSQSVVTDNMPDWGNIDLFNNTNGYSCIKDKLIGFGLDFTNTKTLAFDDFEQAVYKNYYSDVPQGSSNPQLTINRHSSGRVHSGITWRSYRSGWKANRAWGPMHEDTGSGLYIGNDSENIQNQVLQVSTGSFINGGSATGGAFIGNIYNFEAGKKYRVSIKGRIKGGKREGNTIKTGGPDEIRVKLAQWNTPGAAYIDFDFTREWKTVSQTFTVHKTTTKSYWDKLGPGSVYIMLEGGSDKNISEGATDGTTGGVAGGIGVNGFIRGVENGVVRGSGWYLMASNLDTGDFYAKDTTYELDEVKIEEVLTTNDTNYRVFNSLGATIASGSIPSLCPTISAREDIIFNKYKLELEPEANTLTVYTQSPTETIYTQRAKVDITGAFNKYPAMVGAGISTVSHVNTRTNCEVKKLSLTGGKSKPETTIYVTAERVKQE